MMMRATFSPDVIYLNDDRRAISWPSVQREADQAWDAIALELASNPAGRRDARAANIARLRPLCQRVRIEADLERLLAELEAEIDRLG